MNLYDLEINETDGGGAITLPAYRELLRRAGKWNPYKEVQYQYEMAYERLALSKTGNVNLGAYSLQNTWSELWARPLGSLYLITGSPSAPKTLLGGAPPPRTCSGAMNDLTKSASKA